jgi:hypothetical protein
VVKRIAVGVGVVLVAGIAASAVWLMTYDGRKDIDLGRWVGAEDPWTQAVMPGARFATDELCGAALPCLQAVTSETLTMYRFAERGDAMAAAQSFGEDGHLSGWVAVRYEPGRLTPAQRADFEYGIGCINTWVSEDGRDC